MNEETNVARLAILVFVGWLCLPFSEYRALTREQQQLQEQLGLLPPSHEIPVTWILQRHSETDSRPSALHPSEVENQNKTRSLPFNSTQHHSNSVGKRAAKGPDHIKQENRTKMPRNVSDNSTSKNSTQPRNQSAVGASSKPQYRNSKHSLRSERRREKE